jgi:phenylacetic acid degradation operon negative regulatory protein
MWNMHSDTAPLAPVFGVRSDGEAGASSASDLLITVFGELLRPAGGTAWTQTLVATLALVGVEEKATRQAISRLADKGWLTSERVGRRTRWHLTTWATDVLERGAERIYGLGRNAADWDGMWLVLLASVPEVQRARRGPLGVRLGWAGFGSVGQGVWVSPRVDREAEVARLMADFEITGATLFRSEMTATGDPVDLAQRAWQPDRLATEYQTFLETIEPLVPTDDASMTGDLIRLVDAWRRFPLLDPDLPPALLPGDWPGDGAARTFARKRASWAPPAAAWWSETDADFD